MATLTRTEPVLTTTTLDSETNRLIVRRLIHDALDRGDFTGTDEFIAPDARFFTSHARPEPYIGPEGFREFISGVRAGIPDMRLNVHSIIAEGELVVVHWTLSGTHTGTLHGVPPTGLTVAVEALELMRVQDGMLVEIVLKLDGVDFMRQLGVLSKSGKIPPPVIAVMKVRYAARRLAGKFRRGRRA
jgi:steroid delta-isomerase-like uncharacterized protein